MPKKKLRVGVIGVGAIATDEVHGHIPNYLNIPEVELVALSDVNGRRARYVADRFGIPQVYTHFRDMLRHNDIDAVSICTPNYLHAAIAVGCLESGVHVLVEKPMALTSEGAEKMVATAREHDRILFVGMNNRFRNDVRALKLMVAQGAIGEVYNVKVGWLRLGTQAQLSSWFTSKAQAGGGPLWDIGLVMLDLALWMLDFPEPESVFATLHTGLSEPESEQVSGLVAPEQKSPYPIEDAATAHIRFKSGTALTVEVSWVSQLGRADDIYIRLNGTRGAAELRNPDSDDIQALRVRGELFGTRMELEPEIAEESSAPSHQRELQHFVDVCLGRETPVVTPEQGLMGVKIVEGIYQSAASGKLVRFDESATIDLSKNGTAVHDDEPAEQEQDPTVTSQQ